MKQNSERWVTVTESEFPHEREGLERVRSFLPDTDPYYAWSNFTFTSQQGQPYEVDLLVLGPAGLHLVELKAWSGDIRPVGNGHHFWRAAGQERKNPVLLTNHKAKLLSSLLQREARGGNAYVPWVYDAVLLHSRGVVSHLPDDVASRVFAMDKEKGSGLRAIVADRLTDPPPNGGPVSAGQAKALAALINATLQPRPKQVRVGQWLLKEMIDDGPGWVDNLAVHESLGDTTARVRRYFPPRGASATQAEAIRRGAEREFQLTRGLVHPGLDVPTEYSNIDGIGAVVYKHYPEAKSLPAWLAGHPSLPIEPRLGVVRDVAETLRYAHEQNLAHRGLNPESILVTDNADGSVAVRVKDWQTVGSAEPAMSQSTSQLSVWQDLKGEAAGAYSAPEVAAGNIIDRRPADVFSLGAVAYLLATGKAPADSAEDLLERLRSTDGLDIAADQDAAPELLSLAIQGATHPIVSQRTASVGVFLGELDDVAIELQGDIEEHVTDPLDATPGVELPGGFVVKSVLGRGATALALEVVNGADKQTVLKVALSEDYGDRLADEATALGLLDDSGLVVRLIEGPVSVGGRTSLHMEYAGARLADEIQRQGRLSLDRLQRWGRDLIEMVGLLEQEGVNHRDIKPANLAYRPRASDGEPHLVLFDFSLAGHSDSDLSAGTTGYRDPFMAADGRKHFDPPAELFAASVTLYEMATGALPRWGDGRSAIDQTSDEVTVDESAMDRTVASGLARFFRKALARSAGDRYANAQDAAIAWGRAFEVDQTAEVDEGDEAAEAAVLDTALALAGLSSRALSALEQYHVVTVQDLLSLDPLELSRIPGAKQSTRNEIVQRAKDWRRRLLRVTGGIADGHARGLEVTRKTLLRGVSEDTTEGRVIRLMLGLPDATAGTPALKWPTMVVVSDELSLNLSQTSSVWRNFVQSRQSSSAVRELIEDVRSIVQQLQGVATADELATRLIASRGAFSDESQRRPLAYGLVRLAVESMPEDHAAIRRTGRVITIAMDTGDGAPPARVLNTAVELAPVADKIARSHQVITPATTLTELRQVVADTDLADLPDARVLSLAAAISGDVAVSSRGELYPRSMPASQALRMARGTLQLIGAPLSVDALRRRVRARFPEAAELPDRPVLDQIILEVGIELEWNGDGYVVPGVTTHRASTQSSTHHGTGGVDVESVSRRLQASLRSSEFLALAVSAKRHEAVRKKLLGRFDVTEIDVTRFALTRLRRTVEENRADWRFVLATDALPDDDQDRAVVRGVVQEVLHSLHDEIARVEGPVILTQPGVLARFDALDVVTPLASMSSPHDHAVWLLAPQPLEHGAPTIDGAAVPVSAPGQWLVVPGAWLASGPPVTKSKSA